MQLYLIRHAESENNARPAPERIADPAITSMGWRQTECLAAWVQTLSVDTLITSPFRRALDTTRGIIQQAPQHVHVWHDLYERGGCYRGYFAEEIAGADGMGPADIIEQLGLETVACTIDGSIQSSGWWGSRPQETDEQASKRAVTVTDRLQATFGTGDSTVVIVTHADFKRLLLEAMLPGVLNPHAVGAMRNTGITKVNFDGTRWQLDWLNSVSHLPAELITGNEA